MSVILIRAVMLKTTSHYILSALSDTLIIPSHSLAPYIPGLIYIHPAHFFAKGVNCDAIKSSNWYEHLDRIHRSTSQESIIGWPLVTVKWVGAEFSSALVIYIIYLFCITF